MKILYIYCTQQCLLNLKLRFKRSNSDGTLLIKRKVYENFKHRNLFRTDRKQYKQIKSGL